jgi:hypothetical protein
VKTIKIIYLWFLKQTKMRGFTVSKNFSTGKFTDEALLTKAQAIHDSMNENVHFPAPDPTLEELQTAISNYRAALVKSKDGSKEETADKNEKRQLLVELLRKLSYYVQVTSDGDETIILSGGFDTNKQSGTVGVLPKPDNFKVVTGANKGTIELSCDAVDHAAFYEFQYTKAPVTAASVWTMRTATKRKLLIEGLSSGQQYVFRIAAAGSDPNRTWSDEIASYIL